MSKRTYHLPTHVHETIAHWIVKNGGERFHELDGYEAELREGIFQHWLEREDTEYGNPLFMPTSDDLHRITALVAGAKVEVTLPTLEEDEVEESAPPLTWDELNR